MWPFARFIADPSAAANPAASVGTPAQQGPGQRTRTKSSSEIEPIGRRAATLRSSVSSASLKSVPHPQVFRILPPSALSQSTTILAQGQITPLPPGVNWSTPNQAPEPPATSSTPSRERGQRKTVNESSVNEKADQGSKKSKTGRHGKEKQGPDQEASGQVVQNDAESYPFPNVTENEESVGGHEHTSPTSSVQAPQQGSEQGTATPKARSAALASLQSLAHASTIPTINLTRATGSEGSPPPPHFLKGKETKFQAVPDLAKVLKDETFPEPPSTRANRVTSFKVVPIQEASNERLTDAALEPSDKNGHGKKSEEKKTPASPDPTKLAQPKTPSNRQISMESRMSDQSSMSTLIISEAPATTVQRVSSMIGNALAWTALPGVAGPRKASTNPTVPGPSLPESIIPAVPNTTPVLPEAPTHATALPGGVGPEYAARIAVVPTTAGEGLPGQLHVLPGAVEIPAQLQTILAALPADISLDQVVPLLNGCLPIPLVEPKPSIRRAVKQKVRKGVVVHWLNILLGRQVAGVSKPVIKNLPQPSVRVAIKAKFRKSGKTVACPPCTV